MDKGLHKKPILVIDPGHGGTDPGAIDPLYGIQEKRVTLNVALYLKEWALKKGSFTPYLTRDDDRHVSLDERCFTSNSCNADAFLSIHCNARERRGKLGIEIETYHFPGSEKGKIYARLILDILFDLVNKLTPCFNRGVKEKGFYVLKHTKAPAVLVELGFLSDPEEATWLVGSANQEAMAAALGKASGLFLLGR